MKFIKKVPHIAVDISFYEWNQKVIVKFEWNNLEQTYKVGLLDLSSKEEVNAALSDDFIARVLDRFETMQEEWESALGLVL